MRRIFRLCEHDVEVARIVYSTRACERWLECYVSLYSLHYTT
jgi:hypothetical protein